MCDYSLHVFPNRLAVGGEELMVHRFGGTSLGLASRLDLDLQAKRMTCQGSLWTRIKNWLEVQRTLNTPIPAVCVPPGARLLLRDIPKNLQREIGVGDFAEVDFTEISADVNTYRDAIRFANGRQVLMQALREGQRVTVLSLDPVHGEERQWLPAAVR